MYLREFKIHDIKCFEEVHVPFPHDGEDYSGWIVLLGGNGMGKSTLLQAMAIALVGPLAGQRLLLSPDGWVRQGRGYGEFSASIVKGPMDLAVKKAKEHFQTRFAVTGRQEVELDDTTYDQPQLVPRLDGKRALMKGPYAARNKGWFSCGYGPFRRLLGGASEESSLMFALEREVAICHVVPRSRGADPLHGVVECASTADRSTKNTRIKPGLRAPSRRFVALSIACYPERSISHASIRSAFFSRVPAGPKWLYSTSAMAIAASLLWRSIS